MAKMSKLAFCIDELRSAAQSLTAAAGSLTTLFSGNDITPSEQQEASAPIESAPPPPEPKPLTLEQVRAVLADKSRKGFTVGVRSLLLKHGAPKLSEMDPAKYPALLAEAERLGQSEGEADG